MTEQNETKQQPALETGSTYRLDPADINASPEYNSRHYSPTSAQVDRMVLSLLEVGQQQSCRVRPPREGDDDLRMRLIQGFKRHAAATAISDSQGEPFLLRCEVEGAIEDERAFSLSACENVNRDDLSPMDTAFGIDRCVVEFGRKNKEAATLFRVSAPQVTQRRKLVVKLCPVGQEMVHAGTLTVDGALDLIKAFPDLEVQAEAIEKMVKKAEGKKGKPKKAGKTDVASSSGTSQPASNLRSSKELRKEVVGYIGEKDLTTKAVEAALEAGEELPLLYTEGWAEDDLKFRRAFLAALQKYIDGKVKFKVLLKALDAMVGA